MKNHSLLWTALALTSLVAFTACKKDNNSGGGGNTASISGTAFQSSVSSGFDLTSQNNITLMFQQGKGGDTSVITLNFPDTLQVNKAYVIGGANTLVWLEYETPSDWYATYDGQESGSFTITSMNKDSKNIQGNYNAIAWKAGGDSVIITNGKFNVNYHAL
jgi:hypothetical protein